MLHSKSIGLVLTDKIIGLKLGLRLMILLLYIHENFNFNVQLKCVSILLTLIGNGVSNSRKANSVLNSSKDHEYVTEVGLL